MPKFNLETANFKNQDKLLNNKPAKNHLLVNEVYGKTTSKLNIKANSVSKTSGYEILQLDNDNEAKPLIQGNFNDLKKISLWSQNFQLTNDKPSEIDKVAREGCLQAYMLSKLTGYEWGGFVYKDKYNNYHYTLAETDKQKHTIDLNNNELLKQDIPFLKDGNKIIASFHSHPDSNMASTLKVYEYKDPVGKNVDDKDADVNQNPPWVKAKPTYYTINVDKPESDHGQIFSNSDIVNDQNDKHIAGDYLIDPTGRVHKHILPKDQDDETFSYPLAGDIEVVVNKAKK